MLAALVPAAVVTCTLAVPAAPGGVVAVIEVPLTTKTLVAAGGPEVITRFPFPKYATATNRPLP